MSEKNRELNIENNLAELCEVLIGKHLGSGCTRDTFEMEYDNNKVIKIANGKEGRLQNMLEYKIWEELSLEHPHKKWFAPIYDISENGKYLIMKKVDIAKNVDKYPKKVPHYFHDMKYNNFGFIGKQFVICDYAGLQLTTGLKDRMINADWWE